MPLISEDSVPGRDQDEAQPALLRMLSGRPSTTLHDKVPADTVKELHHYALLSLVSYSSDKSKVYTALAKHAGDLFERILPVGKATKQESHLSHSTDKLVRIVLLEGKQAGSAEAVVAFVGPDNLKHLHPNDDTPLAAPVAMLDSWPAAAKDTMGMAIHGSWMLAFNKLAKAGRKSGHDLKSEISKLADKLGVLVTRITCVGHGTGGALATVGAFWMKKVAFPQVPVACVTFGSPAAGNCPFAKEFNMSISHSFRVVHKTDPLTDTPSYLSWEHTGKAVHLYEPCHDKYGAPVLDDGCYIALFLNPPAPLYSYKVKDNNILKYVEGLQEAAAGANIPGLEATLKAQWGPFLQSRFLGLKDNPNANAEEVEELVKQLIMFDSSKVDLAGDALHETLLQYAAWAKAAYSHHVKEGPDSALETLRTVYPDDGVLLPDTLRLVHGMGAIGNSVFIFSQTDTQALVGLLDDQKGGVELVVAFRGSEKKAGDWLTNFSISMTKVDKLVGTAAPVDPAWEIHNGFTEAVNDLLSPDPRKCPMVGLSDGESKTPDDNNRTVLKDLSAIAEHLQTLAGGKPITKVVTCGHSLGGALSKLAAYWCQKVGFKDVPVENYSFGAPRICNWEFAQEWRRTVKTAWRVVHRADPVPAIPFTSWLAGFEYFHVDNAVLLCQPGTHAFLAMAWPPVAEADHYQAQLRRRPAPLTAVVAPSVADHGMGMYIDALSNAWENHPSRLSAVDALKARVTQMANKLSDTLSAGLPTHLSGGKA